MVNGASPEDHASFQRVSSSAAPSPRNSMDEEATQSWQAAHPCILTSFPDFLKLLEGKRLAMFLDYDGTLAPIVSNPDEAFMSEQMRTVVRGIALMFPTAIISGRGREKVEAFVQLKELYYAGSHGMDIASPKVGAPDSLGEGTFQPAVQFKPLIDKVFGELQQRLQHIPGAAAEHNVFCVSAHFRNCAGEAWQDVVAIAEEVVAANGQELRITRGRKVVEIRPQVDWHKGTALRHLMGVLQLADQDDVVALYIGDDQTDEDAFKELKNSHSGLGILVSTKVKPTAARFTVRDPAEVHELLSRLVAWGGTSSNGWNLNGTSGPNSREAAGTSDASGGGNGVSDSSLSSDAVGPAGQ